MSFLRFRKIPRPQKHLKPVIFLGATHFAFHTEVNLKCHLCDSAKSLAPKDTWNLLFSQGNPYILLSILSSTLSVISAIPRNPSPHTFCSPYWGQLYVSFLRFRRIPHSRRHMKLIIFLRKSIHCALHTEVNFKYHFCDSAESFAPKDTWKV